MAGGDGKRGRGSSAGTDSSGRGGKRRAGSTGGPGSGSSSEKGRVTADAATKRMNEALENTCKLSKACKQFDLSDVKTVDWELKTDKKGNIIDDFDGFKAVLDGRRGFFKDVRSLLIHGVVVTQPSSNETYHIVNIKVDDILVLQLLFRQSDGYLVSFRRISTKENVVWEGWYYFMDGIVLPSFCVDQKQMGLESGYTNIYQVNFGKGIVSSIVKCLCAFTQDNCTLVTFEEHNRVVWFETLMVFFGECQRSGVYLAFAEKHFQSDALVGVTAELSKHKGSWVNMSTAILYLYLGFLHRKYRLNGWEAKLKYGVSLMTREIREFTNLGHNSIEKYFAYDDTLDEEGKRCPNFTPLMENLLGSETTHLLHLIKYSKGPVLDIHLTMKKVRNDWSVHETDD